MKCLILAVFLTFAQAPSTTSQKAADSATGTAHAVAKDDNDERAPIRLSRSVANPVAINPSQTISNTPNLQDTPQPVRVRELPPVSVTKDWTDWGVWAFSALLVIVGFLQFCVLWRQAKIMGEHAKHLDNLAKAAKDNAKAASDNAQALINSERAWILVDIGKLPPIAPEPDLVQILWILPTIKNYGKTVARITRVIGIVKLIPEGEKLPIVPEYILGQGFDQQIDMVLPPEVPMQPRLGIGTDELIKVRRGKLSLFVHGFIEYFDGVSEQQRRSAYCFSYVVQGGFSPAETGFYPYLDAPRAYTECT